MLNRRNHVFFGLIALLVLSVCGAASACTVMLGLGMGSGSYVVNDGLMCKCLSVSGSNQGTITLTTNYTGTGQVTIRDFSGQVVTTVNASDCPYLISVEGDVTSSSVEDVELTATWTGSGATPNPTDKVKITVMQVVLESVTFGGTKKHILYKKDAAQWNPDNENFVTNYDTAVPNKAWVRAPALSDPLCYTRSSNGADCTTTVELSITPTLSQPLTVHLKGKNGGVVDFEKQNASLNGASATIGPMNLTNTLTNVVDGCDWGLAWTINISGATDHYVGTSYNFTYTTWGTPGGSTITAKRINWAAYLRGRDALTVTELGQWIGDGWHYDSDFGENNFGNDWNPLDEGGIKNDCLAACIGTVTALRLLGVPVADTGTQMSWASSDNQAPNPNYNSNVTDEEEQGGVNLYYTDNAENPNWPWNRFEGNYKVKDGATWKYWAVFARFGPKVGTGATAGEKDKSARYQILDHVRDNVANFWQKWGGGGTGATATATVTGGVVTAITVTNGGTGYGIVPTVTIKGGGGTGASATATVAGGVVTAITVTNGGTGYTDPTVKITGGGGTGASATSTVAGGVVTAITVTNGGIGFEAAPAVIIMGGGGTGATATATVTHTVFAITVTNGGTGYTTAPTVTITGGGGTGTSATSTVAGGVVTAITVTAGGTGYTTAPTVTITGGGGTGATATATLTGTVAAITVTAGGTGYTAAPTVTITAKIPLP